MKGILYELYRYAICEPGVDGWNAPPLNASNLNDISNALQAVNITQQERTTLGAEATDTLGQILAALKTTTDESINQAISQLQQSISSIQTQIGTNKYYIGSYVGNNQDSVVLTLNYPPKAIFFYSPATQTAGDTSKIAWWNYWIYNSQVLNANLVSSYDDNTTVVLSGNTLTIKNTRSPGIILNARNATVYYIVFG